MTGWQIYWLTRMDAITDDLSVILAAIGLVGVVFGIAFVNGFPNRYDYTPSRLWVPKMAAASLILGVLLGIFVPTTKEMAAIILIPKLTTAVAQNEKLMNLPN